MLKMLDTLNMLGALGALKKLGTLKALGLFNLLKSNSFENEFHITARKDKKLVLKYIIILLNKLTLSYK
jgi:hypothetical protein